MCGWASRASCARHPRFHSGASTPHPPRGSRATRPTAAKALAKGVAEIGDLQERLFAESLSGGKRSVLLVLQGMDTSGKGGTVEHVLESVDPHGLRIHSFKAPTRRRRRTTSCGASSHSCRRAGFLGVFDRSHYEDVLIARVHAAGARRGDRAPLRR